MNATVPRPRVATLGLSEEGRLLLECPMTLNLLAKQVDGWVWLPELKAWEYPATRETVERLRTFFPSLHVYPEVDLHLARPATSQPADWVGAEPVEPIPLKRPPYAHQIAAFNHCLAVKHPALFLEMRCGKTPTAIAAMGRRFQRGEIARVLVVALTSVVPEWDRQLAEFADYPYSLLLLEGPLKKRAERLAAWKTNPARLQVAVVNWDAVAPLLPALLSWNPDLVVGDETQKIKNPTTQRTRAMWKLGWRARYRMILTGTPVTQGAEDLFAQYCFLDPGLLGTSFAKFKARHLEMGGYNDRQVIGYRELDVLTEKIHSVAFRVRLRDTYDMPPEVEAIRYCELEPGAARAYRELEQESATDLGNQSTVTADNVLTRLLRLQQVAGGFVTDDDRNDRQVSTAKLDLLAEVLDEALAGDPERKVVVFARFLPELDAIRRLLARLDLPHVTIQGGTKDRGEVIRRFREDPSVRVFVGQIQTAGVGIPLDVADTAVYFSTTFSFADYDQARSRIRAVGKATPRQHVALLARNTVDEHVQRALARKRNVADDVVDRWRELFHAAPAGE